VIQQSQVSFAYQSLFIFFAKEQKILRFYQFFANYFLFLCCLQKGNDKKRLLKAVFFKIKSLLIYKLVLMQSD